MMLLQEHGPMVSLKLQLNSQIRYKIISTRCNKYYYQYENHELMHFDVLGPRLPRDVSQYQIIVNPMGDGILMLGGKETFKNALDEINELKCNPRCKWNKNYGHKLPSTRSAFIAFYVPNKNLPCGASLTQLSLAQPNPIQPITIKPNLTVTQ